MAEKRDLLDQFNNDSVVGLELDSDVDVSDSTSILVLPAPSLADRTIEKKSNSTLQWELATLKSLNNPPSPNFDEVQRVIEAALGFRPNPWQINGLLDVKNGCDTVVLAGTGSGKSLLFQALLLIKKNAIVLVVMPTLALMENQLQAIEKHGTSVVALTSDAIAADPQVWKRVEARAYSIVLASPEVLLQYASVFLLRTIRDRSSAFTKRLACITVDEAHLIWGWRTFRKEYATLGTLRHCFSKVPMMALFATVTPNVLGYIGESLHLHSPTRLHKQALDRPNITQMVNSITKPGFQDLDFLIPKAGLISKTMVFVNKIEEGIALAAYLKSLLPPEQRGQGDLLIRTFNSNHETSTRSDFLEDFRTGETRILICTDAAGMGVNIPNITRVIQWMLSDYLTLAVLMQRIGHAGRKSSIPAVSVVFVEDIHLLPEDVSTLTETTILENNQVLVKTSPF